MDRGIHIKSFRLTAPVQITEACIVAFSFAAGAAIALVIGFPHAFLLPAAGIAAVALFLVYPELALAAYVVVGDVKGNESVASLLPVDLTLAMGAVLVAGIGLNWLRGRKPLRPPAVYFLFIALIAMMAASLVYTPALEAGLDKFARFLTVTGIVIVAPFFVLNTAAAMKRFLIGFCAAALAICAWSLSSLGGSVRLASPSDNTIGLGHIACALFVIVWVGIVARYSFPRRATAYPLLAVAALALIGSGSRGSVIACLLIVALSVLWNRRLLLDVCCFAVIGITCIPFARLPGSSITYLSTLVRSQSVSSLLSFRGDLLAYGWSLFQQHPLIGAGLGGFQYYSPNPALYKWPHNIFLEIGCELGLPALLLAVAIFGEAAGKAIHQLRNRVPPFGALPQVTAALLLVGIVNALNTGNMNSDRSTWLFVSLVFAAGGLGMNELHRLQVGVPAQVET